MLARCRSKKGRNLCKPQLPPATAPWPASHQNHLTMSDTPSSGLNRRPPARNNLKPCHLWRKGSCRFGERCKFSHEQKPTTSTNVSYTQTPLQVFELNTKGIKKKKFRTTRLLEEGRKSRRIQMQGTAGLTHRPGK